MLSLPKLLHFSFLNSNFSNAHPEQSAWTLNQWLTLFKVFAKKSCHELSSAPVAFTVRHAELINPLMSYHCRDLMHTGFPLKRLWSRLLACGVADALPELIGKKHSRRDLHKPQLIPLPQKRLFLSDRLGAEPGEGSGWHILCAEPQKQLWEEAAGGAQSFQVL